MFFFVINFLYDTDKGLDFLFEHKASLDQLYKKN